MDRWTLVTTLVAALLQGASLPAREASGDAFVVYCGRAGTSVPSVDPWGTPLADLHFTVERGRGHVGGDVGAVARVGVLGLPGVSSIAWREGHFRYVFQVPRGEYLVRLGCIETQVAASGLRLFDVLAEGEDVFTGLDIYRDAGDFAWLALVAVVPVRDGWLDLEFVPRTPAFPARVSRIGVERMEDGTLPRLAAPRVEGRSGSGRNLLWWDAGGLVQPGVGYTVTRASGPGGPFAPLTPIPVWCGAFVDDSAVPGEQYVYRIGATAGWDGTVELSPPVTVTTGDPVGGELTTYDVRISPDVLSRLARRDVKAELSDGEILYRGEVFPAQVGFDTSQAAWQRRKSIVLDMRRDRHRLLGKRDELVLRAEAADSTQMREILSAQVSHRLNLPAPRVDPVVLLLNGRFVGLRHDVEVLGDRFRRRAGLDWRVGLLARLSRADHWAATWEPAGEQIGEGGNILRLNRLVAELNRLHEEELQLFFEESFYRDRFTDRLAVAAIRGELGLSPTDLYLFRDPHGRWDILRQDHPHGAWGIRDFEEEIAELSEEEAEEALFPLAQLRGRPVASKWLVLLTRFFGVDRFRAAYLDRVEALMAGPLSHREFSDMVDRTHARIAAVALQDIDLWPFDRGKTFRDAPSRLKAAYQSRVSALRDAIRRARARPPEPIVIARFLVQPAASPGWAEIKNRSEQPASLAGYALSASFRRVGRPIARDRALAPGESVRVPLPSSDSAGGTLVLWRREGGERVLADFVFHGHETRGVGHERVADGAAGTAEVTWRRFEEDEEAPGAPAVEPPDYRFRQGVERSRSGDLTLWLIPSMPRSEAARVETAVLRYREEGARDFEEIALRWDEEKFRYIVRLERNDSRPRTEYYFLMASASGPERAVPLGAPELTYALAPLPELEINEVCPRPLRQEGGPGEFVELFNPGEDPVVLRGYYLTDDRRNTTKWRISEDVVVPPKGYAIFYADGLNSGRHTNFKLSNSGEYLGLYGRVEEGNLRIDGVAFRGVPAGQSWGRTQDGTRSFRVWKDPTPGERNLPRIPDEFLENSGSDEAAGEK